VGAGEGEGAISAVTAARARALAFPAAVWVAAIVGVSIAVRAALGGRMAAPWIMVDEIVYSELAKNVAAHGQFLVRGVPSNGYGFVYPVLIAPAWRLFASVPAAYTAAKTINAVLMSLTAVPAYLLARRVLQARLALFAAALSVLVPSMLYTGMLMTENAFYPLFVLAAYLLVRMLERPTALLQVALLAVCGIAFECRAQAVALFPAIACAPFLLALVERQGLRTAPRRFAVLYGIIVGGAALAVLGTAARARSPSSTSTSGSCPSPPSPHCGSRPGRRAPRVARLRSPRSASLSGSSPRSLRLPLQATSTGSRSGTCSTSPPSR
jgi:hypothetical protein